MTHKQFKSDLQRGCGSCFYSLMTDEGRLKYREDLLWGCLHTLPYDPQCEGSRAGYLYRLLSQYPDKAAFLPIITDKYLSDTGKDIWLFEQLTGILVLYAADGFGAAEEAVQKKYALLYDRLLRRRRTTGGLDLLPSLFEHLTIALLSLKKDYPQSISADYDRLFAKNKRYRKDDFCWFFFTLSKKAPPKAVRTAPAKTVPSRTAEALLAEGSEDRPISVASLVMFARQASDEERKKLSEVIESEPSGAKKAMLLRALRGKNYPGDPGTPVEYAESGDPVLSAAAKELLTGCQSEAAYRYAKKCLEKNPSDAAAIECCLMNYRKADKEMLLSLLSTLPIDRESRSGWHGIVMQILAASERGVRLPTEFFCFIYDRSLCSCCREKAVRHLGRRGALTPEMKAECRHDSSEAIQKYIRRFSK